MTNRKRESSLKRGVWTNPARVGQPAVQWRLRWPRLDLASVGYTDRGSRADVLGEAVALRADVSRLTP